MNLMLDTASSLDNESGLPHDCSRLLRLAAQRQQVTSNDLMRGARELSILHGDQEYRLRITQNDKLILTK